jgi:hypothetical protein
MVADRSALVEITTGAAMMFGFGILWLLTGLFRGRPLPIWFQLLLLAAGAALATSIVILGGTASSIAAPSIPIPPDHIAIDREIARRFYIIFGLEMVAVFLTVIVLRALHYADYILCGIALIVGVHFFPLAPLLSAPVYYGTALGGCAIGVIGFFIDDASLRQKVVGISFGLLLWTTAAWITWMGLAATSHVAGTLPRT